MRLHRFFIAENLIKNRDVKVSDPDLIHQWRNVFRLKTGDQLILLDNSGFEFLCEITDIKKDYAELAMRESREVINVPKCRVTLYVALIKKGNFEWILEKATEIGVKKIVPVISERSEKKDLNMERARIIIKEASEQSGRGMLPEITEPVFLADTLQRLMILLLHFTHKAFLWTIKFYLKKK
jgi:16S rRNA (uracil1498-N3)-methyltransferase